MKLSRTLKELGVVGAGGAGFPTCVKAASRVEFMLANGAECEPLIHKDVELMKNFPAEIVSGMNLMMAATLSHKGLFGIKKKAQAAIDSLAPHLQSSNIEFTKLGDFYPSGDEYELVYTATGRIIPPAGIPLQVGCVVNNVETLYNVHQAHQGKPVTQKFVSITGAVKKPCSFRVPIGTSLRELIELAGGPTVPEFGMFVSGIMMGTLTFDLDDVVTKTTAGLIILPRGHFLVTRKSQPQQNMNRIGKSACDQCSYCTELCPRYLLGYEIVPHKVMRSLGFTLRGSDQWNQWAELCCGCGLCTLYSCPEDLFPKEACDQAKIDSRAAGMKFVQKKEVRVHPMKESRRVPLSQLRKRLKIEQYETDAPFRKLDYVPKRARIRLKQHMGQAASPVVHEGDAVKQGDLIAEVAEKDLGANLHSSLDGKVKSVTEHWIEIES
jgi:Na+-translocating ferredoxin:NAD+ oxidoreductase RnfC subunit